MTDNIYTVKGNFAKWLRINRYHFYGWFTFLFYEIILVGLYLGKFGHPLRYIINYGINIGLFYFHALFVLHIGVHYFRKRFYILPLLLIFETLLYTCIIFSVQYLLIKYSNVLETNSIKFDREFVLSTLFRAFYFIIFATGYYFLEHYLQQRKKAEGLEKTRLENMVQIAESESAYLRAQINPHFLFNTLDFIYHDARETAPLAAELIVSLADMMRHAVTYSPDIKLIKIGEEIFQVENLINIHQLRNQHALNIHLFYEEEVYNIEIIPLVLITLVENIFKHGDLTNPKCPGKVSIELQREKLLIYTCNLVSEKKIAGLGTGMKNVEKRLQYAYADKASLKSTTSQNGLFELWLSIPIN